MAIFKKAKQTLTTPEYGRILKVISELENLLRFYEKYVFETDDSPSNLKIIETIKNELYLNYQKKKNLEEQGKKFLTDDDVQNHPVRPKANYGLPLDLQARYDKVDKIDNL